MNHLISVKKSAGQINCGVGGKEKGSGLTALLNHKKRTRRKKVQRYERKRMESYSRTTVVGMVEVN